MKHAYRVCCLALSIAVLVRGKDVLSASTGEKSQLEGAIKSDENERTVAKRQTSFHDNDFGQQQVPQDYFEFVRQTDAAGNDPEAPPRRPPPFGQQNTQSQQLLGTGTPSDVSTPPPRTTTKSPFALEQQRLQEEYARRVLIEQLTALNRPRTRRPPVAQPAQLQPQFQDQSSPGSQQLLQQQPRAPLRFLDVDGRVREQEFAAAPQQDFAVDQQQGFTSQQQGFTSQQQGFAPQQQEFAPQQQEFASQQQVFAPQQQSFATSRPSSSESFSYAQIQFGPVTADEGAPSPPPPATGGRPKGQRSVSRPAVANHVRATDALTEQSIDRPVTTVDSVPAVEYPVTTTTTTTTIGPPGLLSARQLQNVVYIQPNGQMYKPIEDVEPVVQIPRRGPSQSTASSTAGTVTTTTAAAAATSPAEYDDQRVVLIPQPPVPKKSVGQSRPRAQGQQEGRKPGRARPEITASQHQPNLRQHHDQQPFRSSEVEPDNFVTSLLSRLQQQHHEHLELDDGTIASVPVTTTVRPRGGGGGGRGSKGGHRSESSKYLADRNQLQLLQFPHELKALSTAELKALEEASVQIAAANDKSVGLKKHNHHHQTSTRNGRPPALLHTAPQPQPQPTTTTAVRLAAGNRPVPTPVELNEQQRQFLASQGIRHLYRVDYDQSGNVLPLTYVLALDNRAKRIEQDGQEQQ